MKLLRLRESSVGDTLTREVGVAVASSKRFLLQVDA